MDLKKIAGLVKIIEESSFKEFSYEDEDVKIDLFADEDDDEL